MKSARSPPPEPQRGISEADDQSFKVYGEVKGESEGVGVNCG